MQNSDSNINFLGKLALNFFQSQKIPSQEMMNEASHAFQNCLNKTKDKVDLVEKCIDSHTKQKHIISESFSTTQQIANADSLLIQIKSPIIKSVVTREIANVSTEVTKAKFQQNKVSVESMNLSCDQFNISGKNMTYNFHQDPLQKKVCSNIYKLNLESEHQTRLLTKCLNGLNAIENKNNVAKYKQLNVNESSIETMLW